MNLTELIGLLTALRDQKPNAEVRVATLTPGTYQPEYIKVRHVKFGRAGLRDRTSQVLIFLGEVEK